MLTVFGIMLGGIIVGIFLRKIPDIKFMGKLIFAFVFLLLLFLGIAVGHNDKIISSLSTIGFDALVITIGALAGSLLCAWYVYKRFFEKENNQTNQQ